MDHSTLIITLFLTTMTLVMFWAWLSKREALSGKHHLGNRDERKRAYAVIQPRERPNDRD